ncbi:hypothetical protein HLH34_12740 [Gluconacetobacter azotocaptans]|uniref:Sarcosine oxidase subunit gamma n=1 Tax=Gluconacetobacter azotocaptans TaxID=142834 RepID=A0A7W4JTW6_9PROT|nr:sarcosine oxidase subunit gamma family protein [Gluconacetobacter azotocaptans]MBB2190817.1 hypothetical protein [Gluconacetobacter azotocaptans]MBM9400737.1 hypothetical protein [Gluconacetobacter azotocaptans]
MATILTSAGFPAPEARRMTANSTGRVVWAGRGQYLVIAPAGAPDPAQRLRPPCAGRAAITTQGDGRSAFRITGERSAAFLAGLSGIDLHPHAFATGDVASGLIRHIGVLFWKDRDDTFECLVFRSLANAFHHDLAEAAAMFVVD